MCACVCMLNPISYVIRFFLHVYDVSIRTQSLFLSRNRCRLCVSLPSEHHRHRHNPGTAHVFSPSALPPLRYFTFFLFLSHASYLRRRRPRHTAIRFIRVTRDRTRNQITSKLETDLDDFAHSLPSIAEPRRPFYHADV